MATPSPSPSPPPPQSPSSNPKPLATKKPQPVPWTHQETINLIQSYQDKWYSLKRGQLKASQWEEVAVTVAAKCGYDYSNPSAKSAIQCRHKMEKLRKRYRSEKQGGATTSTSPWQFFYLMDCLDRGPLPISARPIALLPFDAHNGGNGGVDDDDDEEEEEEEEENYIKSRSINYILRRPTFVNRFSGIMRGSPMKRPRIAEEEVGVEVEVEEEGERERERERKMGRELAAEIRGFAERFVGMEKRKMEMMKETERCRMEMENKRIKMIMDSQRKIVDMIDTAFGSHNKVKMEQES